MSDKPIPLDLGAMTPLPLKPAEPKAKLEPVVEANAAPSEAVAVEPPRYDPIDLSYVDSKLHKHLDVNAPPPVRLMGAKAMVPMGPKDMVHVVYQAMLDPVTKIAAIAEATFHKFDDRILIPAASEKLAPQVALELARAHGKNESFAEKLMLNRHCPDEAVVEIATTTTSTELLGIVARNQERLLRAHDIVRAISANEATLKSDLERAVDFLVRQGVILDDVKEFEDSFLRLGKGELLKALKIEKAAEKVAASDSGEIESIVDDEGKRTSDRPRSEGDFKLLKNSEQQKWAMLNKECAMWALNSQVRSIAMMGIKNDALTEREVAKVLTKRSMHDSVIKVICMNKDWTKSYNVKLLLAQHPKTPANTARACLSVLRLNDLKTLAKSKQIPSNVAQQARKLMQAKQRR